MSEKSNVLVNLVKKAVGLPTAPSSCCGTTPATETAGSCCSTAPTTNQATNSCCSTAPGGAQNGSSCCG